MGTIGSLAMLVFPALHVAMPHIHIIQITDHGARLVEWVAEGSLDAAFVAIAGQIELPRGVTSRIVGVDPIGILAPASCELLSTDRRQLAGRTVITYTIDHSGEELDRRVVSVGATALRAATAETPVRMGRLLGHPVAKPRSLLRAYLSDSDRELPSPKFGGPYLPWLPQAQRLRSGRRYFRSSAGSSGWLGPRAHLVEFSPTESTLVLLGSAVPMSRAMGTADALVNTRGSRASDSYVRRRAPVSRGT